MFLTISTWISTGKISMRSSWWQQSRLNRASSPISPTWAAVVKDGNCESSVYLSMGTRFRIFFHGQKNGNGRFRYSNRSANVWRFAICRSSESGGGTTHVCMGALRAGSWTRAKTLMEILTFFLKIPMETMETWKSWWRLYIKYPWQQECQNI